MTEKAEKMYVWVPPEKDDGLRIYGRWAGDPEGQREDAQRCIAEVHDAAMGRFFQCQRKRGHGPSGEFCKQHAKGDNLK